MASRNFIVILPALSCTISSLFTTMCKKILKWVWDQPIFFYIWKEKHDAFIEYANTPSRPQHIHQSLCTCNIFLRVFNYLIHCSLSNNFLTFWTQLTVDLGKNWDPDEEPVVAFVLGSIPCSSDISTVDVVWVLEFPEWIVNWGQLSCWMRCCVANQSLTIWGTLWCICRETCITCYVNGSLVSLPHGMSSSYMS